jgi:hypothetical protein
MKARAASFSTRRGGGSKSDGFASKRTGSGFVRRAERRQDEAETPGYLRLKDFFSSVIRSAFVLVEGGVPSDAICIQCWPSE